MIYYKKLLLAASFFVLARNFLKALTLDTLTVRMLANVPSNDSMHMLLKSVLFCMIRSRKRLQSLMDIKDGKVFAVVSGTFGNSSNISRHPTMR